MSTYLYLSLLPEALIASQLPPHDFGNYLAVGTKKRTRGQAMFFEVNRHFQSDVFHLEDIERRCVPHADGVPKRSVYLSIYRVLERIPLEILRNLYLVTDDGRVLEIERKPYQPPTEGSLHLYQELCPVSPRIATKLNPLEFCRFVTDTARPVSVPRIVFAELLLNGLAADPLQASDDDLPYRNLAHLRDCLIGLEEHPEKISKTVIRVMQGDLLYRTISTGFFLGDQKECLYYPFPSKEELESKHHIWWRSALIQGFQY